MFEIGGRPGRGIEGGLIANRGKFQRIFSMNRKGKKTIEITNHPNNSTLNPYGYIGYGLLGGLIQNHTT